MKAVATNCLTMFRPSFRSCGVQLQERESYARFFPHLRMWRLFTHGPHSYYPIHGLHRYSHLFQHESWAGAVVSGQPTRSLCDLLGAQMPPAQATLGDTLKIIQIAFYTIGMIIAILTYRAAKRGLLNTVNTEYQKRVMDRRHKLSEDLYSEFEPSSPTHWATVRPVHHATEHINEVFENHMDEILAARKYYYGTPITEDVKRLYHLLAPVVSDPFIPENIRAAVVDLLRNRLHVLHGIYIREFEKYADGLAKGKQLRLTELDDVNRLHNKIVDQMNKQGCGITQIEQEVHEIRGLIQDYFDSFNPHRRWWDRREQAATKVDPCDWWPSPFRNTVIVNRPFPTNPRFGRGVHHLRDGR
jgi:hypothetical protein